MSTQKTLRDVLIVLVLVAAAIWIFGSRRQGPIERAHDMMTGGPQNTADTGEMPMGHSRAMYQVSDGETLVSYNGQSMGSDWFDQAVAAKKEEYLSGGADDQTAERNAQLDVLESGLTELAVLDALREFDIKPDPKDIEAAENSFRSEFKSEEEIQGFLDQMGVTMDRVRKMWSDDSETKALKARVAEMSGVAPGGDAAENAFSEWLIQKVTSTQWVFEDPDLEVLFGTIRQEILSPDSEGRGTEEPSVDPGAAPPESSDTN